MQRNTLNFLKYFLAFFIVFSLSSCEDTFDDIFDKDKDRVLAAEEVPQVIQDYIAENFPNTTIVFAEYDHNDREAYEIILSNGIELYFDKDGNFLYQDDEDYYPNGDDDDRVIDLDQTPQPILDYVAQNFPDLNIIRVEYDHDDREAYEVTLSNGIELYFDKDGNFLYQEDDDDYPNSDDDDRVIDLDQTPQPILDYVAQNFPDLNIIRVEYDHDDREAYEVTLSNGAELYFDKDGNFLGIDREDYDQDDRAVAIDSLPEAIHEYINQNYPNTQIIYATFDIDDRYYEIVLSNGLELYFDENGTFLRID